MTDPASPTTGAPVRMGGVAKAYGPVEVLRGFDLDVDAGRKVAIIGRSGSGKSTVLRILMGLEEIDAGQVEIDGETLWSDELARKASARETRRRLQRIRSRVGMVFQHFHLFPHLTVQENLTLAPIRVLGLAREEAEGLASELLERVGLREKAAAYPAHLSGGQQQRVAIARALSMRPRLMLFDEVTSALDPELVSEVLAVLRDLAREGGTTMLFVTHQMRFAREIADEIVFVDGGRVVERGAPERVLVDPSEERTRTFLRAILEP